MAFHINSLTEAVRRALQRGWDTDAEDDAPGELEIKPDGGRMATVLNSKILWTVGGLAAVGFVLMTNNGGSHKAAGGGAQGLRASAPISSGSSGTPANWSIPHKKGAPSSKPIKQPSRSSATATTGSSPTAVSKPPQASGKPATVQTIATAPNPYQHAAPPKKQKRPYTATPQYQAAVASLHGGGASMNTAWGSAKAQGAAQPSRTPYLAHKSGSGAKPKAQASVYNKAFVTKPASPYELMQGTVIPAVLQTGINSDLPGMVTATVQRDVYSSVNGRYLLVPAGSKLVGRYASKVIAGQTRLAVAWTRVILPNGDYVTLGSFPGADSAGYSGFHDLVNNHLWKIFKNSLLLSLVNAGMASASSNIGTGTSTSNTYLASAGQGMAQTFGQAASKILQKNIGIAPTLTIRPGYVFEVVVTGDVVFPGPYTSGSTPQSTATGSALPATIANPYGR